MCGAKHMMGGSAKDCTLECVKGGAKYILVDPSGKIYQLSDQKQPGAVAGAKVKVTGTLKGDTIPFRRLPRRISQRKKLATAALSRRFRLMPQRCVPQEIEYPL